MKVTTLKVAIHSEESNAVFGDNIIHLELLDEAAGPFFKISNLSMSKQKEGEVLLTLEEIEIIHKQAIRIENEYNKNNKE